MEAAGTQELVRPEVEPRGGALRISDTRRATDLSVSVVVPTLNEERNLPHVLNEIPPQCECVVVDGDSTDGTMAMALTSRPDAVVFKQSRCGKGNALTEGIQRASGDVIVLLDADGSTRPSEIGRFVEAIANGAEFAKGSRFMRGGGSADITKVRQLGNSMLTGLVNVLFKTSFTDITYGYNALSAKAGPKLGPLESDGFEIEVLMSMRAAKAGMRVAEVPSFEAQRIHGVSNLNAFRDGYLILKTILRERFRRR